MNLLLLSTVIVIRSVNFLAKCQENVALGKIVFESSSEFPYNGSLVVDGLFSPPFCFKSLSSGYQKIIVDLIWLYQVDFVRIYGKTIKNDLNVGLATPKSMVIQCYNLTSRLNERNVLFSCPNPGNIISKKIIIEQNTTSPDVMLVCEVVVEGKYSEGRVISNCSFSFLLNNDLHN
ncbi:hypothetical protein HELRODRAFT_177588 [Helobdella robusta]|uniref:Fucolectin tachylectin-4 pentraxin-1 domain-containing protein n=1 Tax=Helobdella robusta TaxID=6412 RepID=T1FBW7_HELRO|nr:hypothetical protein HELRODRAFT_177588 [Helobdella robusta]ESN97926.1 hypothetical protein HELRODRAFT_177588 [Helobdella robusta]